MVGDTIDEPGSERGSGGGVIDTALLGIGAAMGRVERSSPAVVRRDLGLRVLLYGLFSLAVGAGAVAAATAVGVSSPVLLGGAAVVATVVPVFLGLCEVYAAVTTVSRSVEPTGDGTYRVDRRDSIGALSTLMAEMAGFLEARLAADGGATTSAVATDD
jgi:hypothetical protein